MAAFVVVHTRVDKSPGKPPPNSNCGTELSLDFIAPRAGESCTRACSRLTAVRGCDWHALGYNGRDMCLATASVSGVTKPVFAAGEPGASIARD